MFSNYFKVAIRNIRKHKFFSFINIVGLAIGLTACLLIGLYISDELSYDKFHKDVANIYRIGLFGRLAGQEINSTTSCNPLANTLVTEVPGVEAATRIWRQGNTIFKYDDKTFMEENVFMADSNFFEFFSFVLVEGDPKTALLEPNSIVLSKTTALKYFGNESPIGKLMTIGNENQTCKVTGVCEDVPHNSHIHFEAILAGSDNDFFQEMAWTNNSIYTYYRKNPKTSVEEIDAKLVSITRKNVGSELERFLGMNFDQFLKDGGAYRYFSFPMTDSHLYTAHLDHDSEAPSDIKYVYVLGAIGLFILIIACINFMNLSTARSAGRAKEVGLRKTLGSLRTHLIGQFLSESIIYALVSAVLAVVAVYLLLPAFNVLSGKVLTYGSILSAPFLLSLGVMIVGVGLIAGSYPAFYLTSFNAVEVMKGKLRGGAKSKGIRSGLVVFQFSISIILIICTGVVFQQLTFMQEKNIGLDKQNVIILKNTRRLGANTQAFKQTLLQESFIEEASYSNNIFPGVNSNSVFRIDGTDQDRLLACYWADYDQQKVMKFEMAAGRYYSKEFATDSAACILNEAAVKEFGWEDGLNKRVISFQGESPDTLNVIGVAKDFNFESLKSAVRPLIIMLSAEGRSLQIRYSGSPQQVLATTEERWKKYAAGEPFEYVFLDQNFDEIFREEQRLSTLATVLTSLAIFVACMGLFGLAAFMAEQRTKEIGIRKVMGASVINLSLMLSKEFLLLVGIAFGLAVVPAWYFMGQWLDSFAYRIDLPVWIFIVSGLLAALVAWITISFQSVKAAVANPINSLRYE